MGFILTHTDCLCWRLINKPIQHYKTSFLG